LGAEKQEMDALKAVKCERYLEHIRQTATIAIEKSSTLEPLTLRQPQLGSHDRRLISLSPIIERFNARHVMMNFVPALPIVSVPFGEEDDDAHTMDGPDRVASI
jgi:hypothetical protein